MRSRSSELDLLCDDIDDFQTSAVKKWLTRDYQAIHARLEQFFESSVDLLFPAGAYRLQLDLKFFCGTERFFPRPRVAGIGRIDR